MVKRDTVIIAFGGCMIGVFGAGVVTAMEKANIYRYIESVYGISSGAHDLAYFLARDTRNGSQIYLDNLIKNDFVKSKNIFKLPWELFVRTFNVRYHLDTILDIDYLSKAESRERILNQGNITNQPINFFVKVFDIRSVKSVWLDAKQNTLLAIKAAASASPFYPHSVAINGRKYCDSSVISDFEDDALFNEVIKNPGKKYIVIINAPIKSMVGLPGVFGNFLWALFVGMYFRSWGIFTKKLNIFKKYSTLVKLLSQPNVFPVVSEIAVPLYCTNKKNLERLYIHGIKLGEGVIKKIT